MIFQIEIIYNIEPKRRGKCEEKNKEHFRQIFVNISRTFLEKVLVTIYRSELKVQSLLKFLLRTVMSDKLHNTFQNTQQGKNNRCIAKVKVYKTSLVLFDISIKIKWYCEP